MTQPYRLTPKAQNDLRSISQYTKKQWGKRQSKIYISKLRARIEILASNPELGKKRTEIQEDIRSFPEGEHLIFYILSDGTVEFIGILHNRMDIPSNLN
jgi:toxin ParE1/3/4